MALAALGDGGIASSCHAGSVGAHPWRERPRPIRPRAERDRPLVCAAGARAGAGADPRVQSRQPMVQLDRGRLRLGAPGAGGPAGARGADRERLPVDHHAGGVPSGGRVPAPQLMRRQSRRARGRRLAVPGRCQEPKKNRSCWPLPRVLYSRRHADLTDQRTEPTLLDDASAAQGRCQAPTGGRQEPRYGRGSFRSGFSDSRQVRSMPPPAHARVCRRFSLPGLRLTLPPAAGTLHA